MAWEGLVATLADRYLKDAENLCLTSDYVMRRHEAADRIATNCDAETVHYSVQKNMPEPRGYAGAGVLNFSAKNLWEKMEHNWRGLIVEDSMSLIDSMKYADDIAMVKRYAKIMDNLMEGLRDWFKTGWYIDGSAAGNELLMEGLLTFSGYNASYSLVGDVVAYPNSTYHGTTCTPGQEGSWSTLLTTKPNAQLATDWPKGEGKHNYAHWSPIIANTTSNQWGTGAVTWIENCEVCLRRVIQWLALRKGTSGTQLAVILEGDLFSEFKDKMSAKNRRLPIHGPSADLGFGDTLTFEGAAMRADYGVSANNGWVWNFEKSELCSLAPDLFWRLGPQQSLKDGGAYLFLAGFFGNLRVKSPKYFGRLYPVAAA